MNAPTPDQESWERVAGALRAFVARRVPGSDADDVLQEALLRVHQRIGQLQDEERLVPWLYQVTRNVVTDYYRRPAAPATLPEQEAEQLAEPAEPDESERELLQRCVLQFVDAVPEPNRTALRRVDVDGTPLTELAASLAIPLPTAKARVQRGRRQLREALESCCKLERDGRGRVVGCGDRSGRC